MMRGQPWRALIQRASFLAAVGVLCCAAESALARPSVPKAPPSATPAKALPVKHGAVDDSFRPHPAADLTLQPLALRHANALADFVEGSRLEEAGELEAALAVYQKVLTVDPGEVDLALRVASLLVRQEDFPRAIDVLKDSIKAKPSEVAPYLQLSFIYSKFLEKPAQALNYANQAIALDPHNIEGYERAYEIELASGDAAKALAVLDRGAKVETTNGSFWSRLGRLYATALFKPGEEPRREDIQRVNGFFARAAENAGTDAAIVKEAADYFAASDQIKEAIPLYLKVLELEPDDANAREKLATGFVVTNQRSKAAEVLREIIAQHPEKFQSYDLLAQVLDDEARDLQRAKQLDAAKAKFAEAAAAYEQASVANPRHAQTYLRLGELLVGPLRQSDRAETMLAGARLRFRGAPEFSYLLAIAQREAKHSQQAVVTFEEARAEAEAIGSTMLNARFYFDYGAAAEQAGLFDKAADLFRSSIASDPANAAEVYNYLGFMWAEHDMHLDDAEAMIRKALDLDPNNAAYLDSLGWVKYRKGRFDEALADLLRAAQSMKNDDPVVFEHIADSYAKLGRSSQALDYWQKAIALTPDNKALAEKIENAKTKFSKGEPVKGPRQ